MSTVINKLINIIFFGLAAFLLYKALDEIENLSEVKFTTLCLFSLCLFLISIFKDNLSTISLLGLKAELREKISEADEIISKLKSLALLLTKPTADMMASLGTWDSGFSHKEKMNFINDASLLLNSLDFKPTEIVKALELIHNFNLNDLLSKARESFIIKHQEKIKFLEKRRQKDFPSPIKPEDNEAYNKICEQIKNYNNYIKEKQELLSGRKQGFHSYQVLFNTINECPYLESTEKGEMLLSKEHLENLKYYCEYKKFPPEYELETMV